MRLKKCPRCELNYIQEDEDYCKVCKREMKGESPREEPELCTVCNERPVMPGKDICYFCFKEMTEQDDQNDAEAPVAMDVSMDPVSSMDEIVSDTDNTDIPEGEYREIENDLSLDEMGDEEERENESLEMDEE